MDLTESQIGDGNYC